ncbi:MAG: histidine kinase dimerization/phospho-acceptor domain-containing protein [Salinibacter sp.]
MRASARRGCCRCDRLAGQKQELRRQKSLLEQAQRLTGAWMMDLRTDEVSWSEEGYRIHGLDPNTELSLDEAFEFPTSEAMPKLREAFGRCVDEGVPYDLEHPIVTTGGTRRWVRTVRAPVEEENGEVVKVAGAFQDITPQKEVLQVLREEQEVLRRMYHITADRDAAFDAKVEKLMDLGRSYLDLSYGYVARVSGDTQVITHAAGDHPSIRSGERVPLSRTYCRRTVEEGLLAVHDASAAGGTDDPAAEALGVEAYIGSTVEVGGDLYGTFCFAAEAPREDAFSEREQTFVELLTLWTGYELDRRRATRRLEAQNQRLDRFASVVSHDLRTPLNVAQGRLQLARDAVDPDTATSASEATDESPDAIDHLDAAGRALERVNELIEDMLVLTWGRREADPDEIAPVHLRAVAERCWPDVDEAAASLTVETDGKIVAHEGRLRQLLENLFRNALDHGGADVGVRVGLLS